jgi:para-nitrobenzyl esterase
MVRRRYPRLAPGAGSVNHRAPEVRLGAAALRGAALPGGGYLFAGVPFAAPPTGRLRFRSPRPAVPREGIRDAASFAPAPVQAAGFVPGIEDCAEDCLYLNIWTPGPEGGHPVVVWLYGGGFEGGSASPPHTSGEAMMRQGNLVVVTPNYRLGALGFLHLAGLDQATWAHDANVGHLDQIAALAWVRDHIAAFGGDPANVTLSGESAGAFSGAALAAIPAAAGLFHKLLLISGGASRVLPGETAADQARDVCAGLGATSPARLSMVPASEILAAQFAAIDHDIGRRNSPGGRFWGGVLDGTVMTAHPAEAIRRGALRAVPVVTCTTAHEMRVFEIRHGAAYRPSDEASLLREMAGGVGHERAHALLGFYHREYPGASLARLRTLYLSDYIYRARSAALAADQIAAGGRAWSLVFGFCSARLGPPGGAHHGLIGAYLTGPDAGRPDTVLSDPAAFGVRARLVEFVAAFARGGDPGWSEHRAGDATTLLLGPREQLIADPPPEVAGLWAGVAFT